MTKSLDRPFEPGDDVTELTRAAWGRSRSRTDAAQVKLRALLEERALLRAALVGLVGVDGREVLEHMEALMRRIPAPADDRANSIAAIQALLRTLPPAAEVQR